MLTMNIDSYSEEIQSRIKEIETETYNNTKEVNLTYLKDKGINDELALALFEESWKEAPEYVKNYTAFLRSKGMTVEEVEEFITSPSFTSPSNLNE